MQAASTSPRARRRRCVTRICSSKASTQSTKTRSTTDLAKHFSDEEIIELGLFCAEVDGVGKFVKSLNVLSWEEACELNPKLKAEAAQVAAE